MAVKRVLLLSKAYSFKLQDSPGFYDKKRKLNIVSIEGVDYPVVTIEGAPPTQSKTFAYPGDDDPDPVDESCY